ncbi:hypothetical protein I4I73_28980 [Pseudonocardia sp. KRD-184]|uniref:Uncharacterized protein n=1 Tax=Pseudonocardia oceani TaxID=2792013 RepID=A0ABS6UK13_9PSEU|nr:hypothetical protein [Pseudonocardia oceani]MBW0088219.1 hypothetical protein [Pseudonocardia oceani]MBW0100019.1 hypothetical protein [Pseudonocardia oceani]MBW0121146.1 hypothetical protein [Pseudonocardia oceani]MBW0131168.1 hypothetical protein [Pseudonocardia oceani]MBW0132570.1 hypothetical protein [Pseudonocardia oceani]
MPVPDLLRIACAAVAIMLMAACIYAMFRSRDADQRLRFGSTALIALVVVAGQLDTLGGPGNWRMPVLLVALVLFTIGAVRFLVKDRRRALER